MSLNHVSTYTRFSKNRGGTTGNVGDFVLQSGGGGDFVLQSKGDIPRILQSGTTDFVLQSPFTCFTKVLQSGNGDFVLQSGGGTDKVLANGYCTSKVMESGDKVRATS